MYRVDCNSLTFLYLAGIHAFAVWKKKINWWKKKHSKCIICLFWSEVWMKRFRSFPICSMYLNILVFLQETLPSSSTRKEWVLELFFDISDNQPYHCAVLISSCCSCSTIKEGRNLIIGRDTNLFTITVRNCTTHKNMILALMLL